MSSSKIQIRLEEANDVDEVDTLISSVFGPGMTTRAAYALREGRAHEPQLAFVAEADGDIIGSVRQTQIIWGDKPALMLGPLGVAKSQEGKGVGRALLAKSVEAARDMAISNGPPIIILVGDLAYYKQAGFKRIVPTRITLPRPVDQSRVLSCELVAGTLEHYSGAAIRM